MSSQRYPICYRLRAAISKGGNYSGGWTVGAVPCACPRGSAQWLPLDVDRDGLPGQAQGTAPTWYPPAE